MRKFLTEFTLLAVLKGDLAFLQKRLGYLTGLTGGKISYYNF
jgi:hypothetical protein